jgi:hypothetical protein
MIELNEIYQLGIDMMEQYKFNPNYIFNSLGGISLSGLALSIYFCKRARRLERVATEELYWRAPKELREKGIKGEE